MREFSGSQVGRVHVPLTTYVSLNLEVPKRIAFYVFFFFFVLAVQRLLQIVFPLKFPLPFCCMFSFHHQ